MRRAGGVGGDLGEPDAVRVPEELAPPRPRRRCGAGEPTAAGLQDGALVQRARAQASDRVAVVVDVDDRRQVVRPVRGSASAAGARSPLRSPGPARAARGEQVAAVEARRELAGRQRSDGSRPRPSDGRASSKRPLSGPTSQRPSASTATRLTGRADAGVDDRESDVPRLADPTSERRQQVGGGRRVRRPARRP